MRDRFLRRPQRPGTHDAFAFGNRPAGVPSVPPNLALQLAERELKIAAAEPAFAITGSVTFTLAVIAISRIPYFRATENRNCAVRKLWTIGLGCGTRRKKRCEIHNCTLHDAKPEWLRSNTESLFRNQPSLCVFAPLGGDLCILGLAFGDRYYRRH